MRGAAVELVVVLEDSGVPFDAEVVVVSEGAAGSDEVVTAAPAVE